MTIPGLSFKSLPYRLPLFQGRRVHLSFVKYNLFLIRWILEKIAYQKASTTVCFIRIGMFWSFVRRVGVCLEVMFKYFSMSLRVIELSKRPSTMECVATNQRVWQTKRKTNSTKFSSFRANWSKMTAEANLHIVNFLNVTFDLSSGKYELYRKLNDNLL